MPDNRGIRVTAKQAENLEGCLRGFISLPESESGLDERGKESVTHFLSAVTQARAMLGESELEAPEGHELVACIDAGDDVLNAALGTVASMVGAYELVGSRRNAGVAANLYMELVLANCELEGDGDAEQSDDTA